MRIAPYWQRAFHEGVGPRGRQLTVRAYGWSFQSADEARELAAQRAKLTFERLCERIQHAGAIADSSAFEYYPNPPIREEILERLDFGGDAPTLITRNRYGAEILNSPSVFIADIDLPQPRPQFGGLIGLIASLFRGNNNNNNSGISPEQVETEARIAQWCQRSPERGARLYRTAAGLRLIVTDALCEPNSAETTQRLEQLGADPLYRRLTQHQQCFRARLTPKPWRIRMNALNVEWPWESRRHESQAEAWLKRYGKASESQRVCELITTYGPEPSDETIKATLALHDKRCRIDADGPLT